MAGHRRRRWKGAPCSTPGWKRQFPGQVTLEHTLEGSSLPRPVDCWVTVPGDPPRQLAYWIVDARLKLEARQAILAGLRLPGVSTTWVLLSSLLQPEPHNPENQVRLSPTERDFLIESPYDQVGAEKRRFPGSYGRSLHYLDLEQHTLTSYRSLALVHAPNIFAGRRLQSPLAETQAEDQSGEFVHLGEAQALVFSQARIAERLEREKLAAERLESYLSRRAPPPHPAAFIDHSPLAKTVDPQIEARREAWGKASRPAGEAAPTSDSAPSSNPVTASSPAPSSSPAPFQGAGLSQKAAYICVQCGRLTEDWWTTFLLDGERRCRCRDCLKDFQHVIIAAGFSNPLMERCNG